MNRYEALAKALQAIAGGKLAEGHEILRSNFLRTHRTAADELLDIQERTKIYEANNYRHEPWPEYVAALLLSVISGLDKRGKAIVDRCQAILDAALDVAMEENCGVDSLAEMAIAARDVTDHRFFMTCICVAKHHLEWKDPTAARKWLNRLENSGLDGIFLTTVETIRQQCQDEEDRANQTSRSSDDRRIDRRYLHSTVTAKGLTTIPRDVREALSIEPGAMLEYEVDGDRVTIRVARGAAELQGALVSDKGRGLTFAEIRAAAAANWLRDREK